MTFLLCDTDRLVRPTNLTSRINGKKTHRTRMHENLLSTHPIRGEEMPKFLGGNINVCVQYMHVCMYNGWIIPDIILLTQCDYIGEPVRYHEEFLPLQPMFPPKYFNHNFQLKVDAQKV